MAPFFRDRFYRGLTLCLTALLVVSAAHSVRADDCKRVSNILVLFDASGFMKDKERYQQLLVQMRFFERAMPLTADGLFNVGLRHYGLKVGLGCENTESVLAIQPWDPEKFINAFPRSVSYGVSSLSAGLRAAATEISTDVDGKSILVLVGGGVESCNADPVKIADQICRNNPDLEIHTFQIGNAQDGRYYLRAIAQKGRGVYINANDINSPAPWHAWMKRYLVEPCSQSQAPPVGSLPQQSVGPVTFDFNSFSVRSKDPEADRANAASLAAAAQALKQDATLRLVLHGFADGRGKPEYNQKISVKRAEAVARELIAGHGIPLSQLQIVGHGSTQSMLQPPGTVPDRMGRRVEFEFTR
ncbi:MAG: OmpA family protein [Desulfomonilaceae bacterium]|nr:OmpA family protein [Desulfomonilaceae bacterium]